VLLLLTSTFLAGCTDNGLGRKCIPMFGDAGVPPGSETFLSSPALECPTRLCLVETKAGMVDRAVCTAQCQTDADCQNGLIGNSSDQFCGSSFVCAVATIQGAFKCKTVCVCKDDLVCGVNGNGDGGAFTPAACGNPSPAPNCPRAPVTNVPASFAP
jgi:hypothetical protein